LDYPHTYRFVDDAIATRRSIRAYLPKPVPRQVIEDILQIATRAPSGTNTQPWRVNVLTGASKAELSARILKVFNDPLANAEHKEEYPYYPTQWQSPYIDRRRKVGWDLYGLLGIEKTDKQRMHAQHAKNYSFFDAPVGLMFSIERVMQQGSWLDYGMFLQTVMVAARARGLDTCPQAAFTQYHRVIGEFLDYGPNEQFVCGMSLGYADPSAIENSLVTDRAAVNEFARFKE
jgi:nitroreductase